VRLRVLAGDREVAVEVPDLPGLPPRVDETPVAADVRRVGPGLYSVLLDGRSFEVALDLRPDRPDEPGEVTVDGRTMTVSVEDERRRLTRGGAGGVESGGGGGGATVAAPMPGRVVAVPVAPGDRVERGQTVVVLEAMKMESALTTPHAGRVAEVLVSPGETVQQRQVLVRVEG
jgi:biotin carboxyl carrier protein